VAGHRPVVRAFALLVALVSGAHAQHNVPPGAADALRRDILRRTRDPLAVALPPADSFQLGGRTIAAGERYQGRAAAAYGDLVVIGTVLGDAIAVDGDVVIQKGGHVAGDALAIRGRVRQEGGLVDGEIRSLSSLVTEDRPSAKLSGAARTKRAVYLVGSVLTVAMLIGLGVLLFAGDNLAGVVETLERSFARSFLVGIAGELALAPVLIVGLVGLAITIIGILLIPFAAVAYVLAAAGLFTLGFLAIARVTGNSLSRPSTDQRSERQRSLRALTMGVLIYFAIWLVAAGFSWSSVAGPLLRVVAAIITWVAVTAGAGAVILSRGGTRRVVIEPAKLEIEDSRSWETPTPVSGVVAARRPTPAPMREVR
jgi:uncharacterized membrane protein YbaN (DUF454 family)